MSVINRLGKHQFVKPIIDLLTAKGLAKGMIQKSSGHIMISLVYRPKCVEVNYAAAVPGKFWHGNGFEVNDGNVQECLRIMEKFFDKYLSVIDSK